MHCVNVHECIGTGAHVSESTVVLSMWRWVRIHNNNLTLLLRCMCIPDTCVHVCAPEICSQILHGSHEMDVFDHMDHLTTLPYTGIKHTLAMNPK